MNKKLLILSCIAALCLTFAACGKEDQDSKDSSGAKESSVAVTANEITTAEDSESAEDISSEEESKAEAKPEPDEDSSKAADGELDDGTATDIITRMVDNVNSNKTCIMKRKMELTEYVYISYAGESMEQNIKHIKETEVTTNKNGQHSVSKDISNDGYGDEIDTKDIYCDIATGVTYSSYDEGQTWYKGISNANKDAILNLDNILESKEALDTADVEKSADGYVITLDASKAEKFTDILTNSFSDVELSGNIVITTDKNYYPLTIEMKDMRFDTSALEDSLKGIGGDEVMPDEVDITFDIGFSFFMTFTNWNDVPDDLVTPSDDIVSKAVAYDY